MKCAQSLDYEIDPEGEAPAAGGAEGDPLRRPNIAHHWLGPKGRRHLMNRDFKVKIESEAAVSG